MLKSCLGRGKLNPIGLSLRRGKILIESTALSVRLPLTLTIGLILVGVEEVVIIKKDIIKSNE